MPTLQHRYSLAAVLIAAGCTGGARNVDPDVETAAETSLSLLRDGLRVSPGAVDFDVVEIGHSGSAQIQLTNTRLLPVWLEPRTVTAGFAVSDDCGRVLRGRASCTINVSFSPEASGEASGTLTIATLFHRHQLALTGSGARRVTVSLAGPGAGHITSTPAGLDCGTTCSALFTGDVTLTATAGDGSRFVGWSAPCSADAACTLPANAASVSATFEGSDTRQIAVTVAGAAPGFIYINDFDSDQGITLCPQPCTAYVPAGHAVHVLGFTPSTFGGWTGCAVPPDPNDPHDCDLGTVTADVATTVTFNRDPREVATLLPPRPVLGLAFTPGGDVLIADAVGVSQMTLSGAVVWSVAIPGGAHDIVTDAAGHIYGSSTKIPFQTTGGAGLFALDSNGTVLWTRNDITVAPSSALGFQSAVAASPDGSVIAAHLADGAWVVDGNGVDRFTVHGVSADGMAVAADGTVAVDKASAAGGDIVAAARFTALGVPLSDLDPIPGSIDVQLTYDAAGALIAQTTGFGSAQESRLLPDGSVVYTVPEVEEAFQTAGGVAVDSLGDAVFARWVINDIGATGLYFEVVAADGNLLFTHEKDTQFRFDILNDGVTVGALATDAHRHIAFGGAYNQDTPWIEVYAMP